MQNIYLHTYVGEWVDIKIPEHDCLTIVLSSGKRSTAQCSRRMSLEIVLVKSSRQVLSHLHSCATRGGTKAPPHGMSKAWQRCSSEIPLIQSERKPRIAELN